MNPNSADGALDGRLFTVVSAILSILVILLLTGLVFQWQNYHAGIQVALTESQTDHAAVITYSRALDAAFVRTSSLFLGFLLVFTGILYVLRKATSAYEFKGNIGTWQATLGTSSPGLVVVTLGVVLICVVLTTHSEVDYQATSIPAAPSEAQADQVQAVAPTPTLGMTEPPSGERK